MYTSEIGDGDAHNQENKSMLLCGQLGGTIKTGQHLRFPRKARHAVRILRQRLRDDFEGDFAPQLGIRGAVHLAHSALAKLGRDPVVRDALVRSHFTLFRSSSKKF